MKAKLDIAKSWNQVSDTWQKRIQPLFSRGDLLWGTYGPWERDVKLISPVRGKRVLVAGCGSAPDVWWLMKHGAKSAVGIDISSRQLQFARERMKSANLKAEFIQKDLDKLSKNQFKAGTFELVISNYALQYVRDLPRLFEVLAYFLRPGGKFVFSFDHPVSTAVGEKVLKRGKQTHVDYLNERIQHWSFSDWNASGDRKVSAYSYHRTVSSIYNALVRAGFTIEKILEPKPIMKGGVGNTRKYEAAKRIPETIILVSKKK